ncbi:hypothetical protein [Flavobacterium agri]|nr:hypothetical protein [Flavobacterium agri]
MKNSENMSRDSKSANKTGAKTSTSRSRSTDSKPATRSRTPEKK